MKDIFEVVLKYGPRFMESAQRNWFGALFLITVVVAVMGVPVLGAIYGAGRAVTALFR